MERRYYEAYDDRYRQVHGQGLHWFDEVPTVIVQQIIEKYKITRSHKLLELGCGEGRDAFPLLRSGYDLLATDVSDAAINYCRNKEPKYANHFQILDCVTGQTDQRFDFIYAVAVVHMLVPQEDRDGFYTFLRDHLVPGGIALVCTMGDGEMERQTDIRSAFHLQSRTHEQTGREVQIASTSCRMVSFSTFAAEVKQNGLVIMEKGLTKAEPDFPSLMYAVVTTDKEK